MRDDFPEGLLTLINVNYIKFSKQHSSIVFIGFILLNYNHEVILLTNIDIIY